MTKFFRNLLNLVAGRSERRFGRDLLRELGIRVREPDGGRRRIKLVYHRTTAVCSADIIANGFKDGEGHYLTEQLHRGVWVSDDPLTVNEGARGDVVLQIQIPIDFDLSRWEWVEEGKQYREWLIPAAVINQFPRAIFEDDFWPNGFGPN